MRTTVAGSSLRLLLIPSLALGLAACLGIQGCGYDDYEPTEPAQIATGTFTISAAPLIVPVLQGGEGESKITLVRNGGFIGSVALAVAGAPPGLTARINPSSTTGTEATLIVTTLASVSATSASLLITATAAGQIDQRTTVTVEIRPPGIDETGNVTVDFSTCPAAGRPIWFAFHDGAGAWTQILGSAHVYRFNIASAKGGYAFVAAVWRGVTVSLAAQAELTSSTISPCGAAVPSLLLKTVSGTLAGLSPGDVVYLGMGGPNPDPEGGPVASSFTLSGLQDGNLDLIAYRSSPPEFGTSERVIIRRDQNIANNGTLGIIDFNAAESFAPATATVTVTGAGSVPFKHEHAMSYYAGAACSYYDLYYHSNIGVNDFTMRGIPAAQQRATDFHSIFVHSSSGNSRRYVLESFHTLANRTIALPAALPVPTITTPAGGHRRMQASLTLPPDYQQSLYLDFYYNEPRGAAGQGVMTASFAWLGGATATLAFPDFSRVTGWKSSFMPASDASSSWYMSARGANSAGAGGPCVENARFVFASVSGTGPI